MPPITYQDRIGRTDSTPSSDWPPSSCSMKKRQSRGSPPAAEDDSGQRPTGNTRKRGVIRVGMTSVAVQTAKRVTELRRLLDQGKEPGFITYDDDLDRSLVQDDLDTTQVEYLLDSYPGRHRNRLQDCKRQELCSSLAVEELPAEVVVKEGGGPRSRRDGLVRRTAAGQLRARLAARNRQDPLLSMDEEITPRQAHRARSWRPLSAKRAKDTLTQANLRLVVSIAKRYSGRGMSLPRPDPGGQHRPDPRRREVRLPQGLQVQHLRDLVDPPGHHPRHRRPGPHHPHPGPHGRDHQQAGQASARSCCRSTAASRRCEESPARWNSASERVSEIISVAPEPLSLETPIGEEEDSHLADFIEDREAGSPADAASHLHAAGSRSRTSWPPHRRASAKC